MAWRSTRTRRKILISTGCLNFMPLHHIGGIVANCAEINQCVGCTRQFFTKSFLGDDGGGGGIATPSSRRRADGVEDDATVQHDI